MGGIMSSSQAGVGAGQMGGTGPWVSVLGAGQSGGNRLRDGSLEGARGSGGASNSSLSMGGVGPLDGTSLGVVGGQHQLVDVVLSGQVGRHHRRGVEGARSLGGASNSPLSVAGAGSMGGVVEIVEDEDGEESSDDKVEVINEPPSAAAHPAATHPAPNPLERDTDTVSFRHF